MVVVVVEEEEELAESAIELDVVEEPEDEVDGEEEDGEASWLGELVGTVSSFAMPILESLCAEPC